MSGQRLIPTREHLAAVIEKTGSFLKYLRDAGLIENDKVPPIPESTIAYRKGNALSRWSEWERVMNPSNAFFHAPPCEVAAGGWSDWRGLHYALVDLYALRSELITHWGLGPVVGAESVKLSFEASGIPGSGEKAAFVTGAFDSPTGGSQPVRLEKPVDWPPTVGIKWRKQCVYALKRMKGVLRAEDSHATGSTSIREPHDKAQSGEAESRHDSGMSDLEFVNAAIRGLGDLINACAEFQIAGAQHPDVAGIQRAPFELVKSRVARMTGFATSRLDNLCVKLLQTRRGERSVELLEAVMNPIRLDASDQYECALRERYDRLSKLGIILENDARHTSQPSVDAGVAPNKGPAPAIANPVVAYSGGLMNLDLPGIFRCTVELAEAVACVPRADWEMVPVDIEGPQSPHFARWIAWANHIGRVEEESVRAKRMMAVTGPITLQDRIAIEGWDRRTPAPPAAWECFEKKFSNTAHDRIVRLALTKIATGVIELSGFATWREPQWDMREQGVRLLAWGMAQLWEGLTQHERSYVQGYLPRLQKAIGWPVNAGAAIPPYDGPEDVPIEYQYRTIAPDKGYVACYPGYLQDVEDARSVERRKQEERALRRCTIAQFVEVAERAIQALTNRVCDTPRELADLRSGASNALAFLMRAKDVEPGADWPETAQEHRNGIAAAAEPLLVWICGDVESKKKLNLEDAAKALETLKMITGKLKGMSMSVHGSLAIADMPKPIHFGIITVKEEEFKAIEKRFSLVHEYRGSHRSYLHGQAKTLDGRIQNVLIARCLEQGQNDALQCASDIIRDADPQWILVVGIGGSLPVEEHSLGDVLLANRVYDFAVTAANADGTVEPNPKGGGVHPQVAQLLQTLPSVVCQAKLGEWNSDTAISMQRPVIKIPNRSDARAYTGSKEWTKKVIASLKANFPKNCLPRKPLFRIGPVATGNTLVKDPQLAEEWKTAARSISHIEMELGGAYAEAQRVHKPLLSIRSMSDVVGFQRSSVWTDYACNAAASFTHALIISGLIAFEPSEH
jgi:nucleoside phosphorylase